MEEPKGCVSLARTGVKKSKEDNKTQVMPSEKNSSSNETRGVFEDALFGLHTVAAWRVAAPRLMSTLLLSTLAGNVRKNPDCLYKACPLNSWTGYEIVLEGDVNTEMTNNRL